MLKSLLFILKYNIIKEPINLSNHLYEFNKLNKSTQRKVLDIYFKKLDKNFNIEHNFNNNFFSNYYFDIYIIDYNIYNIRLIDKFNIEQSKIDKIINNTINVLNDIDKFNIENIFIDKNTLPSRLSSNIDFMIYLCNRDYHNIKYITYNPSNRDKQNTLISTMTSIAKKNEYNINKFMINNTIPKILLCNIDFLIYILSNDINNITLIDRGVLEDLSDKEIDLLIDCLINNKVNIDLILNNYIHKFLFTNYKFIIYLINNNINYIKYIDWYNTKDTDKIIDYITNILIDNKINLNIDRYSFKSIFYRNYNFMLYLISKDIYNIKYIDIKDNNLCNKLIDIVLNNGNITEVSMLLSNDSYINKYLVENEKMFRYLFRLDNNLIKYINFYDIDKPNMVVTYLVKEINSKNYEYNNSNFLVNNKYPIPLSNNYLFMKYVIDMNFNNISYMDTSLIDDNNLKKIINYACRMVYYIRGNDKRLNFDIDGYFRNSDIINNKYFRECLNSL